MADTKRISKRTHTSVRLKRTETPAAPVPGAEQPRAPRRRHKARTGRVEAMRAMLPPRPKRRRRPKTPPPARG